MTFLDSAKDFLDNDERAYYASMSHYLVDVNRAIETAENNSPGSEAQASKQDSSDPSLSKSSDNENDCL